MPDWTRTPPSEPGYYWCRRQDDPRSRWIASLDVCGDIRIWSICGAEDWDDEESLVTWVEWWLTPIEPPSEPAP